MIRRIFIIPTVMLSASLVACGGSDGASGSTGSIDDGVVENPIDDPPGSDGGGGGGGGFAQFSCIADGNINGDPEDGDADNDGVPDCDEIQTYGTNPLQADTDGDGFSDREEIVVFDPQSSPVRFNPRVADLAQIAIELTSVPNIELRYQNANEQTQSVTTGHSASDTTGVERNWGGETSRQLEVGHTASASSTNSASVTVEVSPTRLGGSGTFETSLTVGMSRNRTQTQGSSVSWSETQSRENTRTFNESEALSQTSGTTFTGGTLSVTARVINEGAIAYDLQNLTLTAFLFDPARPFNLTPIGNLEFSSGSFPTTSIITNSQSAPLNFSVDLSLDRARELLRDSSTLVIEPATFRLVNQADQSILLSDQEVNARTATVSIDFGKQTEAALSYRVAVANGSGNRFITAEEALQRVLDLQVSEGRASWIFGDNGAPSSAFQGVLSIDEFALSTETNSYWLGAVSSGSESIGGSRTTQILNPLSSDYSLSDIKLRAGDTLSLVYVTDGDRDALPDRYEFDIGTDRQNPDTDGDLVGDAVEVYGYQSNLSSPPCNVGEQFLVTSDPLLADTDGDGVNDGAERATCTNPSFQVLADAGSDQTVNVGSPVTLRGGALGIFSGVPQYTWRLVNGPDLIVNQQATRTLDGIAPSFTAPVKVSSLVFDLDVSVDGGTGPADRVVVQVQQNRDEAVFVGLMPSDANANAAIGTQQNPYGSIEDALANISPGDDLYVMTPVQNGEVVPYELTNSVTVPAGTDLFGAYDNNWIRDVDSRLTPLVLRPSQDFEAVLQYDDLAEQTRLSGFSLVSRADDARFDHDLVALRVDGNSSAAFIAENNRFEAHGRESREDGDTSLAGSSYAAHIANLGRLQFSDNVLVAGAGGDGGNGGNGSAGTNGRNGAAARGVRGGVPVSPDGGDVRAGKGGRGANSDASSLRGSDGEAASSGGARGGSGGAGGDSPGTGRVGGKGRDGQYRPTPLFFKPTEERYMVMRGAFGTRGQPGGGGGGGGAGSPVMAGFIVSVYGGGGGAGGEGGTHGFGGAAGGDGGASIGLWMFNISNANVSSNTIQTAKGGDGGNGGRGGQGGSGGAGGSGAAGQSGLFGTGSRGANGGPGGAGGRGTDGGGGSGGPSIGVLAGSGVNAALADNSITTGNGGNGGANGSTGNGGESVAIFDALPDDGNALRLSNNRFTIGAAGVAGSPAHPDGQTGRNGCAASLYCRAPNTTKQ